MNQFQDIRQQLGKVGLVFLAALVAFPFLAYFRPSGFLLVIDSLLLIIFGVWLLVRFLRFSTHWSLWRLRNRLLLVYFLISILPIALIVILVGLSAYALTSEVAIYLASSELDRRLESIYFAADVLDKMPSKDHQVGMERLLEFNRLRFPGISFHVKDQSGVHHFPPESQDLPHASKPARGLLSKDGRFYGWAHIVNQEKDITVLAPFTTDYLTQMVPKLGEVRLLGEDESSPDSEDGDSIKINLSGGSAAKKKSKDQQKAHRRDLNLSFTHIPPPVNRLDIVIPWASVISFADWNQPDAAPKDGGMIVLTRPSAVINTIFAKVDKARGLLFSALVAIAILFLFVEIVALFIGVSLSRRITGAVHDLYEGTRRVIRGDFRHRIPIRLQDQVGELGESFNQMTGNLERLLVVEKEKERLQTELEIAREVQNQLYPKATPQSAGLQLSVRCEPARIVSGDYYDFQRIHSQIAFAVGDVAGKGISAALLMATVQAALRAQIRNAMEVSLNAPQPEDSVVLSSANLVSQLNQQLYAHTSPEKYATFFFALYDETTSTLSYTNAGHLPPILIRGGQVVTLETNGTVVGAFPFSRYDESRIDLRPDDLLVCYTDGVTEPENAYGEMFGEERLIDLIAKHAKQDDQFIIRTVIDAVRQWTGSPELYDDMTLLLARHTGVAA